MANNPKKIKDPTEAALSAIQDALSIRDRHCARTRTGQSARVDTDSLSPRGMTSAHADEDHFGAAMAGCALTGSR